MADDDDACHTISAITCYFCFAKAEEREEIVCLKSRFWVHGVFTARRYASAVCAVVVCLSVRLSVRPSVCQTQTSALYQND